MMFVNDPYRSFYLNILSIVYQTWSKYDSYMIFKQNSIYFFDDQYFFLIRSS